MMVDNFCFFWGRSEVTGPSIGAGRDVESVEWGLSRCSVLFD